MAERPSRVTTADFARPPEPGGTVLDLLDSLPRLLGAEALRTIARRLAVAAREGRGVLWMIGGHVVKTGLSPLLIHLMDQGGVGYLAGPASVAIHDYEIARWGRTSEDVEAGLREGRFGMAEETGREINEAVVEGARQGWGLGEALGRALESRAEAGELAAPEASLLLAAFRRGVPVGIFTAIGCEVTHQHASADGAAYGDVSMRDFRRLAAWLPEVEGGVVLNVGSLAVMPEVFLKALSLSRNVHGGAPRAFLSADFDMMPRYRPCMNVVQRPTRTGGGEGYEILGHHEVTIPLLVWVVDALLGPESG